MKIYAVMFFLSMASIWEMQIKNQLGKLALDLPLNELIEQQCLKNGLQILAIETTHIYSLKNLPPHHNDPFDRLILVQAQTENLTLITKVSEFVFSRIAVVHSWFPVLLALTS